MLLFWKIALSIPNITIHNSSIYIHWISDALFWCSAFLLLLRGWIPVNATPLDILFSGEKIKKYPVRQQHSVNCFGMTRFLRNISLGTSLKNSLLSRPTCRQREGVNRLHHWLEFIPYRPDIFRKSHSQKDTMPSLIYVQSSSRWAVKLKSIKSGQFSRWEKYQNKHSDKNTYSAN